MIDFEKGIVNRGNWYAIQQVFKKAGRGEPVTIGFLGGSITQGSLASCQENCYASLVFQWCSSISPTPDSSTRASAALPPSLAWHGWRPTCCNTGLI